MKIKVPTEYKKIINTVNIFQLTGDAQKGKETMDANVKRIVRFYYYTVPELTAEDVRTLKHLVLDFYRTASYYRCQYGFSAFIVPTFAVIRNQEWVTINQFLAFLQNKSISDRLNTVDKSVLNELIKATASLKDVYYPKHVHTVVSNNRFRQIMNYI